MKYAVFVLFFIFAGCKKANGEKEDHNQKVIVIQPLGNFSVNQAERVLSEIKAVNPNVVLRKNSAFPKGSFYKPRNRYRADSIIKSLKNNIGKDSVIVGLSEFDISTTKNGIKDWGIMGLGYRPGKSCVVSTFRLSRKSINEQFFKLVLHELGHTEGLPHCKVKTCLMRDAEGGNPFDQEKKFCRNCKTFLENKGWFLI